MVGRLCEEFDCTPDVAVDLPYGLSARIMLLRGYASAREVIQNTEKPEDLRMTPAIQEVLEIQAELAIEAHKEWLASHD
jgi:hypothetical protein